MELFDIITTFASEDYSWGDYLWIILVSGLVLIMGAVVYMRFSGQNKPRAWRINAILVTFGITFGLWANWIHTYLLAPFAPMIYYIFAFFGLSFGLGIWIKYVYQRKTFRDDGKKKLISLGIGVYFLFLAILVTMIEEISRFWMVGFLILSLIGIISPALLLISKWDNRHLWWRDERKVVQKRVAAAEKEKEQNIKTQSWVESLREVFHWAPTWVQEPLSEITPEDIRDGFLSFLDTHSDTIYELRERAGISTDTWDAWGRDLDEYFTGRF